VSSADPLIGSRAVERESVAGSALVRSQPRLIGITGLRGIAAFSILVYHCWLYSAPSGQRMDLGFVSRFVLPYLPVGVTLFFSLSAFLLYRPIVERLLSRGPNPGVLAYLRNRALRILPAYWTVLLITGILLGASVVRLSVGDIGLGRLTDEPSHLLRNLLLVQNYYPDTVITGIAPAWTLAVEAVFYLSLPFLGWAAALAAARTQSDRALTWAAMIPPALLLVIGLSGKIVATWLVTPGTGPSPGWDGDWYSVLVRSFWVQADLFAFGMALAVLWVRVRSGTVRLPRWWRGAALAALGAIALSTTRFREGQVLGSSGWATVLALGCTLILALVVFAPPERGRVSLARMLETRLFVAVGLASYSLFLWHEPLVRWLSHRGVTLEGRKGFILNLLLLAVVSGTLAALTYWFVERPALRLKARGTSDPP
jgi:peptidoglycan/LPS O-acetylase OafA/YrhL